MFADKETIPGAQRVHPKRGADAWAGAGRIQACDRAHRRLLPRTPRGLRHLALHAVPFEVRSRVRIVCDTAVLEP